MSHTMVMCISGERRADSDTRRVKVRADSLFTIAITVFRTAAAAAEASVPLVGPWWDRPVFPSLTCTLTKQLSNCRVLGVGEGMSRLLAWPYVILRVKATHPPCTMAHHSDALTAVGALTVSVQFINLSDGTGALVT